MWHLYSTDHNTAPQDNGPLAKVGEYDSLHRALDAIDQSHDRNDGTVRYVLLYKQKE